jgi:four helix bundle protein
MPFKFEKLEVWRMAMEYIDTIYLVAEKLPRSEDYNLKSQITRAATSVALNIAEGSTGQTDTEQARFLGLALRSLVETGGSALRQAPGLPQDDRTRPKLAPRRGT